MGRLPYLLSGFFGGSATTLGSTSWTWPPRETNSSMALARASCSFCLASTLGNSSTSTAALVFFPGATTRSLSPSGSSSASPSSAAASSSPSSSAPSSSSCSSSSSLMSNLMTAKSRLVIAQWRRLSNATEKNSTALALQGGEHPTGTAPIAVLPQVDPLSGAQRQTPFGYRQVQLEPEQAGLDMGRQIIRPLLIVLVEPIALRHQTVEHPLEVTPHRPIRVLVDGQG